MSRAELNKTEQEQFRILYLLDVCRDLVFNHYGEEIYKDTLPDSMESIFRIIVRVLRGDDE